MYAMNSHKQEYQIFKTMKASMVYDGSEPLEAYQEKARAKLMELLGLPFETVQDAQPIIEYTVDMETHTDTRFLLETEPGYFAPCHLLTPKNAALPAPLRICANGHGSGMHVALGQAKSDKDIKTLEEWPHRAMALRAVSDGCCALVIEPRSFGETSLEGIGTSCTEAAKIAILAGRTLIGGRVWDIMRALDAIQKFFPQVDMKKIACSGNSGGGTTTYYLACLDTRIALAAPSCAVCTFEDSIAAMPHCMCNHVPGIRKFFEMGDMAAMIAPRKLIVAAGAKDMIFPLFGVKRAMQQIENAYALAGAEDHCALVIGDKGHYNYADLIWAKAAEPAFAE